MDKIRDDLKLLSSLYRLDVEEYKIQEALRPADMHPARVITKLIIDRRKEKIRTRKEYGTGKKSWWD